MPTQLLFDWSYCVNCSLERVPMLVSLISLHPDYVLRTYYCSHTVRVIYLLILQIYVYKSVCLSENLSFYLSVSRISRKPFTRSPLRSAGMLHGSRECALSCVRLFRCEQVIHFNEFLCCAFANIYILPSAICRLRIGRQVAHMGPWRTIYNYKEANLSVSVCGDGLAFAPKWAYTLPPSTPSTGTCTS